MAKSLGALVIAVCTLTPQSSSGLRSTNAKTPRHLSTKYCGTDSLSAYLSCTSVTSCLDSDDCNAGESCYELNCPFIEQAQNEDVLDTINPISNNETSMTASTIITNLTTTNVPTTEAADVLDTVDLIDSAINETTTTSSTTNSTSTDTIVTVLSTVANDVTTVANDVTTVANNNETVSITIVYANTTEVNTSQTISSEPTTSPTIINTTSTFSTLAYENWTNFDYYENTKFCGPKVVGGYDVAVAQCGPLTICGMGNITINHYGSSGNDCPQVRAIVSFVTFLDYTPCLSQLISLLYPLAKNFMCYSDITCANGPGPETTTTSTIGFATSTVASTTFVETTTQIITSEVDNSTGTSTITTSISDITTAATTPVDTTTTEVIITSTQPRNPIVLTTRAAFCGSFYAEALLNCGTKTMCTSSNDCNEEDECFENVSCTYAPNSANDDSINVQDESDSDETEQDVEEDDDTFGVVEEETESQDDTKNQVETSDEKEDSFSFAQDEDDNIGTYLGRSIRMRILGGLLVLYSVTF
jgi:hypothetical protein